MEQMLSTLAASPTPIAFEIACDHQERKLIIRGETAPLRNVARQLCEIYDVETEPLDAQADSATTFQTAAGAARPPRTRLAARLFPERPEFLPLKIWREFEAQEPLCALLGAFGDLAPGEVVLSQIILRGAAPRKWSDPHLQQLAAHQRHGFGSGNPVPTKNVLATIGGWACCATMGMTAVWALFDYWPRVLLAAPVCAGLGYLAKRLFNLARNPWVTTLDEDAVEKLHDDAALVELRLFATAATEARARTLLQQLVGTYRLFNTVSGNRLTSEALPAETTPADLTVIGRRSGAILSVAEIAGLWHIPVLESLKLVKRQTFERILPRPEDVGASSPSRALAPIGTARKGAIAFPVGMSGAALNGNMLLVGRTQMGKTTLMERLAYYLALDRDRALLFIDPHGDAAQRLIGLLPPGRAEDIFYINLADDTCAVGLNLLDVHDGGDADPNTVAENFVDVAKALWEDYWGPRMIVPLLNGLKALTYANLQRPPERQFTILALPTLLTCDADTRNAFLSREVPYDLAPAIHRYFKGEFEDSSNSFREQVISPVLSKAHAFERSPIIQRLVGQPSSTLRLHEAIRHHKIIVVNTNAGLLGNDLAGFLGSLFVNVLHKVIMQQAEMASDRRVRVTVIADEFQKMTGVDWGAATGELQKFGGNFILGTQALSNLLKDETSGSRVESLFAGMLTTFAFRTNGADAYYLTRHELDAERVNAESLMNQPRGHAYIKTVNAEGLPIPVFSLEVASPLTPDAEMAQAVLARRKAYTVPAAEADRLFRASLTMLDEYGTYDKHTPEILAAQAAYAATQAAPQAPGDVVGSETPGTPNRKQPSGARTTKSSEASGSVRPKSSGVRPIILRPQSRKVGSAGGVESAEAAASPAPQGLEAAPPAAGVSPETTPLGEAAEMATENATDAPPSPASRPKSRRATGKKERASAAAQSAGSSPAAETGGKPAASAAEFEAVLARGLAQGPAAEQKAST